MASAKSAIPVYTLNNGRTVPMVGLGTWQSRPDGSAYRAVLDALNAGYRHLDCAYVYQNQHEIGRAIGDAIKNGVLKREDLFVTSKIWPTYYRKDRVMINAKQILSELKLDYVDLLLLHWPVCFKQIDNSLFPTDARRNVIGEKEIDYLEAWKGLEAVHQQGLAKSIGISNFNIEQIKDLLENASIVPVTNQVELHPYLVQAELKDYCNQNRIVLTAYSPLGSPGSMINFAADKELILKDAVVRKLATKYGKNPGQILIKYQVSVGNLVIPKSVHKDRIESNIAIFDFDFTADEIAELNALDCDYRLSTFDMVKHLDDYPFEI